MFRGLASSSGGEAGASGVEANPSLRGGDQWSAIFPTSAVPPASASAQLRDRVEAHEEAAAGEAPGLGHLRLHGEAGGAAGHRGRRPLALKLMPVHTPSF